MMLLLAVFLALPAFAQDAADSAGAQVEACLGTIDVDAVGARADAFVAAQEGEARVGALCAAGDPAGATALAREIEDAFYAQDADAARMRACIVEAFGEEQVALDDVCSE